MPRKTRTPSSKDKAGRDGAAAHPLSDALGHEFKNAALLSEALTHMSMAPEGGQGSYERLEFLGDRVLGLIIADVLIKTYPQEREGDLAVRFNALVRAETCEQVAQEAGLGKHIEMSSGEARAGGRKHATILADVCEAVIGALYLDGGLEVAERFIRRYWEPKLSLNLKPPRDSKTVLQEWAQAHGLGLPSYELLKRKGPDHAPTFDVEVAVEGRKPAKGIGSSKRAAEQAAAETLLKREGLISDE